MSDNIGKKRNFVITNLFSSIHSAVVYFFLPTDFATDITYKAEPAEHDQQSIF